MVYNDFIFYIICCISTNSGYVWNYSHILAQYSLQDVYWLHILHRYAAYQQTHDMDQKCPYSRIMLKPEIRDSPQVMFGTQYMTKIKWLLYPSSIYCRRVYNDFIFYIICCISTNSGYVWNESHILVQYIVFRVYTDFIFFIICCISTNSGYVWIYSQILVQYIVFRVCIDFIFYIHMLHINKLRICMRILSYPSTIYCLQGI